MTVYVFPGQGSQARGMCGELFAEFPEIVATADQILGYSSATLCLEDPNNQLNQTQFTQPALYLVNALTYLKAKKNKVALPTYVAGHSLGEYSALFAANVFDFATGLKLVQKRASLMSEASGGGMAAIVGLTADIVQDILQKNKLNNIAIANYNSATQVVISGLKEDVSAAQPIFAAANAKLVIPLNVSGAFHSPLMKPAQEKFGEFIRSFSFNMPSCPVIANVTAQPYGADVAALLTEQITHSVMWTQSIQFLLAQKESEFVEMGPGKVLTGLINRIQKGA